MLPSLGMQVPVSLTSKASPTDKANYPHPHGLAVNEAWHQHVTEVHAKRGDCVIFCEACVHNPPAKQALLFLRKLNSDRVMWDCAGEKRGIGMDGVMDEASQEDEE